MRGHRGYYREGWHNPPPETQAAICRDLMLSSPATALQLAVAAGLSNTTHLGGVLRQLADECGYIITSWSDPALKHTRKFKKRYRITARLDFHGGVAEDYTIPKDSPDASA